MHCFITSTSFFTLLAIFVMLDTILPRKICWTPSFEVFSSFTENIHVVHWGLWVKFSYNVYSQLFVYTFISGLPSALWLQFYVRYTINSFCALLVKVYNIRYTQCWILMVSSGHRLYFSLLICLDFGIHLTSKMYMWPLLHSFGHLFLVFIKVWLEPD